MGQSLILQVSQAVFPWETGFQWGLGIFNRIMFWILLLLALALIILIFRLRNYIKLWLTTTRNTLSELYDQGLGFKRFTGELEFTGRFGNVPIKSKEKVMKRIEIPGSDWTAFVTRWGSRVLRLEPSKPKTPPKKKSRRKK